METKMSPSRKSEESEPSSPSSSNRISLGRILSSPESSNTWEKPSSLSVELTTGDSVVSLRTNDILASSRSDKSRSQNDETESSTSDENEPPCKLFRWSEDGFEFVSNEDFSVNQVRPTMSYTWSPSTVRLSNSEDEGSPKFLFRDLPGEPSMRRISESSSPTSSTLVATPKTPKRTPIANAHKTPVRCLSDDIEHLSPVFCKLEMGRKKFAPKSSLSPFTTKSSPKSESTYCQPIVLLVPESATLKYPALLSQFVTTFEVEIVKGPFDQRVTHVLLDDDNCMKLEHIQAVGFKKYLVKLCWIYHCIREERLLESASFEEVLISGSQVPPTCLARGSMRELFQGYAFFCAKPFYSKISYDQLVELLLHNGGEIIYDPRDFATCKNKVRICLVGEPSYYSIEKNEQELQDRLEGCRCVKVDYEWIFVVFAGFRLQSLIGYLYEPTIDDAISAGVPRNLLE